MGKKKASGRRPIERAAGAHAQRVGKARLGDGSEVVAKAPRQACSFADETSTVDALDTLLQERYHGAVNVRGIRFQVRYAALRAVTLAHAIRAEHESGVDHGEAPNVLTRPLVRMEGIEDVDIAEPTLGPLFVSGDRTSTGAGEYVQVKTAEAPWNWAKLKEPLVAWLELQRTGADHVQLRLLVNFEPRDDLSLLARIDQLQVGARREITKKFRTLAARVGATTEEADAILARLVITSLTSDELRTELRSALVEAFGVADTASLDAYELALTGRVLEWSERRATVSAADVLEFGRVLGEGLSLQTHFDAVANRLIGTADYSPDATPGDFYAGRRTRLGHVAAGLDVRRQAWLDRIGAALERSGVCILRAPSGHGKSTLAFRFAIERWAPSQVIIVRGAETNEDVGAVSAYLRFRAQLGLPLRVLIDADYRTKLWPEVAAVAAAVGAQVLVTVRTEDYQRYPMQALTKREILEPTLSREEACAIFAEFRKRRVVAANVPSAAWAYERLRTPQLLLEYVYLITEGQMLEERLRDQVHSFQQHADDPAKREILRLVGFAGALGAPVRLSALLASVTLQQDPQVVFGSLQGEYLKVEDDLVSGLHWVRSDHLARLLHEGGVPPLHHTAIRLLDMVPSAAVSFVIANALSWQGLDRERFIVGLVDRYRDADTAALLRVVDGIFEAEERQFFLANRAPFDEASAAMGPSGLLWMWADTAPILRTNAIDQLIETMGDKAGGFLRYKEWVAQVGDGPRGLDGVRGFLSEVAPHRTPQMLRPDGPTGDLLGWCAAVGVKLPNWAIARDSVMNLPGVLSLPSEEALHWIEGLFRYDPTAFVHWFDQYREPWLAHVQRRVTALTLSLPSPSTIQTTELARADNPAWTTSEEAQGLDEDARRRALEDAVAARIDVERYGIPTADIDVLFAVPQGEGLRPGEETRLRLDFLRRALPFVGRYRLRGDYMLPVGIVLPVDDTVKAVPRWNLHLPSDLAKNRVWGDVVARAYLPDTFYRFQERWVFARRAALRVVTGLNVGLNRVLQGKAIDLERLFGSGGEAFVDLDAGVRALPWLKAEQFAEIGLPIAQRLLPHLEKGAPNRWSNRIQTTVQQVVEYFNTSNEHSGRLSVVNLRDASTELPGMHAFFDTMFLDAPDYFDSRELNERESSAYSDLELLLIGRITDPIDVPTARPLAALRERAAHHAQRDIDRIAASVEPLTRAGRTVIPQRGIVVTGSLRATALGVDVARIAAPLDDLMPVLEALQSVSEVVDWFYLVPIRDGVRLSDGAYSISAHRLRRESLEREWDATELMMLAMSLSTPLAVPSEVEAILPELPVVHSAPMDALPLRQLALSLFAVGDAFARRLVQIAMVGGERPLPDHETLRLELRADLANAESELRALASRLRREVEDEMRDPASPEVRGAAGVLESLSRAVVELTESTAAGEDVGLPVTMLEVEAALSALESG